MEIVGQVANRSHFAAGGYDRRIMLGYIAFAIVALLAAYFASLGPGFTETELAIATIFP